MCLQDLWIGQYIAHNFTTVTVPVNTLKQVASANPRRVAISITLQTGSINVGPRTASNVNQLMLIQAGLIPAQFDIRRWGSLVTTSWYGLTDQEGLDILVMESFLTLPLETVLSEFNVRMRKEGGIQWQVPNLPLLPRTS